MLTERQLRVLAAFTASISSVYAEIDTPLQEVVVPALAPDYWLERYKVSNYEELEKALAARQQALLIDAAAALTGVKKEYESREDLSGHWFDVDNTEFFLGERFGKFLWVSRKHAIFIEDFGAPVPVLDDDPIRNILEKDGYTYPPNPLDSWNDCNNPILFCYFEPSTNVFSLYVVDDYLSMDAIPRIDPANVYGLSLDKKPGKKTNASDLSYQWQIPVEKPDVAPDQKLEESFTAIQEEFMEDVYAASIEDDRKKRMERFKEISTLYTNFLENFGISVPVLENDPLRNFLTKGYYYLSNLLNSWNYCNKPELYCHFDPSTEILSLYVTEYAIGDDLLHDVKSPTGDDPVNVYGLCIQKRHEEKVDLSDLIYRWKIVSSELEDADLK